MPVYESTFPFLVYSDTLSTLRQNQMSLHLLPKTGDWGRLYGYESDLPWTSQQARHLALESGGIAFNVKWILDNKFTPECKLFFNLIKLPTIRGKPKCESCHCLARIDGQGAFKCHKCIAMN